MNEKQVKKITSLAHSKYRLKYRLFLVEGAHPVSELLKSGWQVESIIMTRDIAVSWKTILGIEPHTPEPETIQVVGDKIFQKLSATATPQGIMAVAKIPDLVPERVASKKKILVADGVSDPGNLGTMIRSAVAFGFNGLITSSGTADIFNPKVIRAAQGALFSLAVADRLDHSQILGILKRSHMIYALAAHEGTDLESLDIIGNIALVVGAEVSGISAELMAAADYIVNISIPGPVESLNAAVAAAIAMYRLSRLHRRPA